MFWRKFKLDWQYAVGELVIVTLGVLVALGIQQWNVDRLEREEEKDVLTHLLVDLEADSIVLDFLESTTADKRTSLARLSAVFESGDPPENSSQFLQDVVVGASLGWNLPTSQSATFDEILSSGKLALVRDSSTRSSISNYYGSFDSMYTRADARETAYPQISYQVIPRHASSQRSFGVFLTSDLKISDEEIAQLVTDVMASEIRNHVGAEANLALFVQLVADDMKKKHQALVQQIQAYRKLLEN